MNCKLYVGNLPYAYTSDELREVFEPHGPVLSATVIIYRKSGRSRGFGFVEYEFENSAQAAIEKISVTSVGEREIVRNQAAIGVRRPRINSPSLAETAPTP
jgi:RNA recognition motif-containing protein